MFVYVCGIWMHLCVSTCVHTCTEAREEVCALLCHSALFRVELEEQPVHPRNLPVSVPHNFGVRAVHTAMYPTIYLVAR